MCDTLVGFSPNGMFFGKNSDREPDEVQNLVLVPRQEHQAGSSLKCTYIEIPQVPHTHEVILSQPYWMWGAEMGVNEFGLTIGNEALFTRLPPRKENTYLLGMDLLRLGLERAKTAKEALDVIIGLLEQYGQGGNCSPKGKQYYNNSFLICDQAEAYVLETVDRMWAWKRITTFWAISNGISLTNDFDEASPNLISTAVEKGWCKSEADFDFQNAYTAGFMTKAAQAPKRRACNWGILEKNEGKYKLSNIFQALRSHAPNDSKVGFNPLNSRWMTVCAHATGLTSPSHSANSIAVWFSKSGKFTVLSTGTSTPCVSIFRPVYGSDLKLPQAYKKAEINPDLSTTWWHGELFNYYALGHYRAATREYFGKRYQLESKIAETLEKGSISQADAEKIFEEAESLRGSQLEKLKTLPIEKAATKGAKTLLKRAKKAGLKIE